MQGPLLYLKDKKRMLQCFNVAMLQGGITEHKAPFAHEHAEINELGDIVKELKFDIKTMVIVMMMMLNHEM